MTDQDYELVVAGPAGRAIADQLPEAVALAVIELITGPLVEQPHRVGAQLRRELVGLHSARRGTFRVLYRVDDEGPCRDRRAGRAPPRRLPTR